MQAYKDGKPGFDLVVLDLCMPVTDGFEACKQIMHFNTKRRQSWQSKFVNFLEPIQPLIVAVTGFIDASIEAKAKAAGFEKVYESPLSDEQIHLEILGELDQRAKKAEKARKKMRKLSKKSGHALAFRELVENRE